MLYKTCHWVLVRNNGVLAADVANTLGLFLLDLLADSILLHISSSKISSSKLFIIRLFKEIR